MPIPYDPAAGTGLPNDTSDKVAPFLRPVAAAAPDREPPRPTPRVAAIDGLGEIQAMIGLVSLAAGGLPAPYAAEFTTTLELVHRRIGATLDALRCDYLSLDRGEA